jgi:biopolymer transport protein ExbD
MASTTRDSDDAITGINVTPLVDVTLVLLIVFIVTAKLITGQGIPLDLPKTATAGAIQTTLTVSVDAEGRMTANGRPIADEQALLEQAKSALREDSRLRTVVSASAATSHGNVMRVVDTLREAGAVRIAFAADKAAARSATARNRHKH